MSRDDVWRIAECYWWALVLAMLVSAELANGGPIDSWAMLSLWWLSLSWCGSLVVYNHFRRT
jgi:hypothetical protein